MDRLPSLRASVAAVALALRDLAVVGSPAGRYPTCAPPIGPPVAAAEVVAALALLMLAARAPSGLRPAASFWTAPFGVALAPTDVAVYGCQTS